MHDTSKLKLHAAQHFPLVSKFVIASKYTNEPHHQQQRNRNLAGKCREKMQFFMTKNEEKRARNAELTLFNDFKRCKHEKQQFRFLSLSEIYIQYNILYI